MAFGLALATGAGPALAHHDLVFIDTAGGGDAERPSSSLPDIAPTRLGFLVGADFVGWGHTMKIVDPKRVKETGSGPQQDLCVIAPAGFRVFNRGLTATGAFTTTIYRDDVVLHVAELSLDARGSGALESFDLPLHEGINIITAVLDSADDVSESDEANVFSINVEIGVDCDGSALVGPGTLNAQQ
jgi:hypothetical protein